MARYKAGTWRQYFAAVCVRFGLKTAGLALGVFGAAFGLIMLVTAVINFRMLDTARFLRGEYDPLLLGVPPAVNCGLIILGGFLVSWRTFKAGRSLVNTAEQIPVVVPVPRPNIAAPESALLVRASTRPNDALDVELLRPAAGAGDCASLLHPAAEGASGAERAVACGS